MQSLKGADAENIGYIIPTNVIYHFLSDYERNGKYTGQFCPCRLIIYFCFSLWEIVTSLVNDLWLLVTHSGWTMAGIPGFPAMGILWQKLENPALRASLRMKPDQKVLLFVILLPVVVAKKPVVRVLRWIMVDKQVKNISGELTKYRLTFHGLQSWVTTTVHERVLLC